MLSEFWTLWVLDTLDIVLLKKVVFPEFQPPLEFQRKLKMLLSYGPLLLEQF